MQVISGLEALQEAGIEVTEENAEELGMIVGTGDGPLTTVYEFQEHILRMEQQQDLPSTKYLHILLKQQMNVKIL